MVKCKKKMDKSISLRLNADDYEKLQVLFFNRPQEYRDKHRNIAEFLRWILLKFVALQRNVVYRENYYNQGIR